MATIKAVIKLKAHKLRAKEGVEHIEVKLNEKGDLCALKWLEETKDFRLKPMAIRRGAVWDYKIHAWAFRNASDAQSLLDVFVKNHPDWPIIGIPSKPVLTLSAIRFSRIPLAAGLDSCLVPFPLPYLSRFCSTPQIFKLTAAGKDSKEVGLLIGSPSEISAFIDSMVMQGASCNDTLAKKWALKTGGSRLQVKVKGWAVQLTCDLSNPLHYLAAPEQKYRAEGHFPDRIMVPIPWTGVINITRKHWPALKAKLLLSGLEWEGDDPEAEIISPLAFDSSRVSGWDSPAPNGNMLHEYQKVGARFCASKGMRALIGDEMGVGKTVQAIAAAEAVNSARILVICPASARYVWDREIKGWGGRGGIQHIMSPLDKVDMRCRWHIVTYDLITTRAETWRLNDVEEKRAFFSAFPDQAKLIKHKHKDGYPLKVTLDKPLVKVPAFADPKRIAAWGKVMQRLRGELLEQFLFIDQLLTVLDEAHRAKNKTAKRTQAIQRIAAGEKQMLMLTGTPLRNNEHEAAVLLGLLDAEALTVLNEEKDYTIQDVKDYLSELMIRRTKANVLPELPGKTRQRIDIGDLDHLLMHDYEDAFDNARKCYFQGLKNRDSPLKTRQRMQGCIEQARLALGVAKVRGGEVLDLVLEVVENKGCCVVFCAHQKVSDELLAQLHKEKLTAAILDGRTPQNEREQIVNDFEGGWLQVFIGGINTAGEAITLTRADTVVFVELDWVPAALLQAEDRIHRVGQERSCQIIQLVARMDEDGFNLDEMMVDLIGSKMAIIGNVLDENTDNIISSSFNIQSKLHDSLLNWFGTEVQVPAEPVAENRQRIRLNF